MNHVYVDLVIKMIEKFLISSYLQNCNIMVHLPV